METSNRLEHKSYSLREAWGKLNYQKLFVCVFLLLMLLPLQKFSLKADTFDKSFWGYGTLVSAYQNFRFSVLRDLVFGNVFIPSEKWMIYSGEESIDDYSHVQVFSEGELKSIQEKIDGVQNRLSRQGIVFLVVVPPNKNTIYPEFMPGNIRVLDRPSRLDQLLQYQKDHGHTAITDLRPALLIAKKNYPVYYAFDSHWNPFGAHAGYVEIMRALQKEIPALEPYPLTRFRAIPDPSTVGDLVKVTNVDLQEGRFSLELIGKSPYTIQQHTAAEKPKTIIITNTQPNLPRLMVFHDSFFDELSPFLANHFSRAVLLATSNIDETAIQADKPDVVIWEVTERYLDRILHPQ